MVNKFAFLACSEKSTHSVPGFLDLLPLSMWQEISRSAEAPCLCYTPSNRLEPISHGRPPEMSR